MCRDHVLLLRAFVRSSLRAQFAGIYGAWMDVQLLAGRVISFLAIICIALTRIAHRRQTQAVYLDVSGAMWRWGAASAWRCPVVAWVAAACEEQAANVGSQKWDYCAPRIDYSEVRRRVGNAFAEKASEIADAVETVQGLSKEATRQFQGAVGPHDITPF